MIDKTELRLGNYLIDDKSRLCQVVRLDITESHSFFAPAIRGGLTSLPNKPIPLTEEWLLKFGFQQSGNYFIKNEIRIHIYGNDEFYFSYERYNITIKHVHHLQNLFFALVGQELF